MTSAAADKLQLPDGLKRTLATIWARVRMLAGVIAFCAAAVAAGTTTSWFAIHSGLSLNTERHGPWVLWTYAGDTAGEPYSRARFASIGALILNADRVLRFEARVDDDGRRLHSACTYEITSPPLNSSWWTLAVFDTQGRLVPNEAQRYGFNQASVARDGAGQFRITLARDAQPGNWLPTGSAGRLIVVLESLEAATDAQDTSSALVLPKIRRVSC